MRVCDVCKGEPEVRLGYFVYGEGEREFDLCATHFEGLKGFLNSMKDEKPAIRKRGRPKKDS